MKFIQLTDTHLTPPGEMLYGIDVHKRLRAAIESINRNHADAEFCAVTGDIADSGEPAAYESFAALMRELHCPYYFILGNHDKRAAARKVFAELPWQADDFLQYALKTAAGRFVFLDTLDEGKDEGILCEARLAHLRDELQAAQAADEDVYVFMHHPPLDVGIHSMDQIKLQNPDALHATLQPFSARIRHLFFGHLHQACRGVWRGIPYSTLKSTAHQMEPVLDDYSGFIASTEMPAYSIVLLQNDDIVIHDRSFLEDDGRIADYP